MFQLLLIIIYLAFISLGLPDSLLGSAWPSMYGELNVAVSYAGVISMIIAGGTIVSSLFSDKLIRKFGTGDGGERCDDGSGPFWFFRVTFLCRALFMGDTLWTRSGERGRRSE